MITPYTTDDKLFPTPGKYDDYENDDEADSELFWWIWNVTDYCMKQIYMSYES